MIGAAAVTAGLATYLAWPARRSSATTRKRRALVEYLREHLSLSEIAVRMLGRLASDQPDPADRMLFSRLADELEQDRAVVRALLLRLGASPRSLMRAAGAASGTVISGMSGGKPGDLSLLRTLEALSVGVQGKRCMWRILQDLPLADVGAVDFVELEAKAVRQWEALEARRRALAALTFPAADQRSVRNVTE